MLNLCIDHIYIDFIKNELLKLCSIFTWVHLSREKLKLIIAKDKSLLKNFLALGQMNKVKQGGILSSIYCCYINSLLENILLFFDQKKDKDMEIPISYINKAILLLNNSILQHFKLIMTNRVVITHSLIKEATAAP